MTVRAKGPATLTEPIEVAKFWRNRRGEAVIVQLSEYEGRALIDLRVNFTTPDGTLRPTKKGLSLVVARLPDLLRAVEKAHGKAVELGLLKGGGRDE